MPKTKFPLTTARKFSIGPRYRWRIVLFSCLGLDFRLLVFYRADKERYGAYLGLCDGSNTRVLARYEYHATHPGWHLHTYCGDIEDVPSGRFKWPGQRRIPRAGEYHRNTKFHLDDSMALYISAKKFGLAYTKEDDLFQ